jgi:iron complex transport system substrate-binding protein
MPAQRPTGTLLLLVLSALLACASGEPTDEAESVVGESVPVSGQAPARRVISLVPSATLTLAALGAQDLLVARTDFDTATWVSALPSVGGGLQPSLEAIVAARPDLVIRFGGPQDTQTPQRLDDLGIAHLAVRPDGIDDVLSMIRLIGSVTGKEAAGDSLVHHLRSELEAVRRSAADRPPVRVAYVLGGTPPWVAGPGTYIHELVELSGGSNVFADLELLYAAASPEEFLGRAIDVVLLARGTAFPTDLAGTARIVEVSPALELPGPGVAESAREIARIPEAHR